MFLCLAIGIANIFRFHLFLIGFSIVCILSAFVILFIEVPLLLRVCPTSAKFDSIISKITTNYMRAATYFVMSLIQWFTPFFAWTSLLVPAILLLLTSICYLLAGLKHQDFVGSKTLGGQGVAQMIV